MGALSVYFLVCLLGPLSWIGGVVKGINIQGNDIKWHYTPVSLDWQREASNRLGVEVRWNLENFWNSRGSELTTPTKVQDIIGDGNCFFRSISYVVTGEQNSHDKIRKAVVDYMRKNMLNEVTEEHLNQMAKSKTWATDSEIIATARLLKTPVFVHTHCGENFVWAQYTPNRDYTLVFDDDIPRIYLKMVNKNHFEVVSDVERPIVTEVVSDVQRPIVTTPETDTKWHFTPVTVDWQQKASTRLGVKVTWSMENYWDTRGSELASPKQVVKIEDDGNSFFRSISYIVTGEEDSHVKIRETLVNYMKKHMPGEFTKEYLKNMSKLQTWATDKEIMVMARLLETPVFVYTPYGKNWIWVQYTSNEDYSLVMDDNIPRIYLKMVNKGYFEVVSSVGP